MSHHIDTLGISDILSAFSRYCKISFDADEDDFECDFECDVAPKDSVEVELHEIYHTQSTQYTESQQSVLRSHKSTERLTVCRERDLPRLQKVKQV